MAAETNPKRPIKKDSQPGQKKRSAAENNSNPSKEKASSVGLQAHHVSNLLDEVLDEPEEEINRRALKYPMVLDLVPALGLLLAIGGFTIGLFKIYLTHSAEQNITQHNYPAAIAILKSLPVPGFFTVPGVDPDELLSQALYLDALDKLEVANDTDGALKELQIIPAGSRYFALAQEIIGENYTPSTTTLQGGASVSEPASPVLTKKPILPEAPQDAVP